MRIIPIAETTVRDITMPHKIGRVVFNDYLGQGHQVWSGPQAYLVNQLDAGSEIYPHFHDVDQFQIFVRGSGRIGTHSVSPVVIHYVDAYSPYGPIVANELGLGYLVLRLAAASGGWKMPESRNLIVGGPGRRTTLRFDGYDKLPTEAGLVQRSTLWRPADDGLEISSFHIGPHSRLEGDAPAGGQYIIVTAGALVHGATLLPKESLIFYERGEPPATLAASTQGATLLVLQFPLPSARQGSDPATLRERDSTYVMPAAPS